MSTANTSSSHSVVNGDFLIEGAEHLAKMKGFKLVGRDEDLKNAATVLMRKQNSSLVLAGQSGVGLSSIIMGLQSGKEDGSVPIDVIGKKFYWLDTDAIFASGDPAVIKASFEKALATLTRAPDTVLVLEDIKDFLDGIRNHGVTSIIHTLMRTIRTNPNLQAIIEGRNEDMTDLFKAHSDIKEFFTFLEVKEPGKDALRQILETQVQSLQEFHGIPLSEDVIPTLVDLAVKYPGVMADVAAQPKRSIMILESALTALRHQEHTHPRHLLELESRLATLTDMTSGNALVKPAPEFQGKTAQELTALRDQTKEQLEKETAAWEKLQKEVSDTYALQVKEETNLRQDNQKIAVLEKKEADDRARVEKNIKDNKEKIHSAEFNNHMQAGGITSSEMDKLIQVRDATQKKLDERVKPKYKTLLAKMNEGVILQSDHILNEFSRISGLSLSKLNEDASVKLLNLPSDIKKRVYGQDHVVDEVSKYIKFGSLGMKPENKPIGNFLFIGPTGVGKTELTKALAEQLFGSENAMTRFDMGGFQEKNSASTLIGAPRGYEGYTEGGRLTNAVRSKPNSIVLFDEVEKAHKDIFDILLSVFDEGAIADTRGLVATFGGVLNIMTSNIGAKHFMNPENTYEQALELAKKDLHNQNKDEGGSGFRPEFLARLDGIFYFKSLENPQIVLIAGKELRNLNKFIEKSGMAVEMAKDDISAMVEDHNNKAIGGRGIRNYINSTIKADIADALLAGAKKGGKISVKYNKAAKKPVVEFGVVDAANNNVKSPTTLKM